ncbi:MAG: cellulase family glycosylhydrolase [Betaproteobacteria bacterium]|nr:cellulase family glycosylhydrolase [Betaproteobacteria bacterium]
MLTGCATRPGAASPERIKISSNGKGFVLHPSGRAFVPWGFNYDHDETGRLIEDYWEAEWPNVEEDFREMKQLGANVVRVHLQFGRFMVSESQPDTNALARFAQLVRLAGNVGLYLDVTGLGCYHKQDVPAWYDALDEEHRWAAQANFWRAIARVSRGSSAIFCYDLMNEPVAPHSNGAGRDWLGPPFAGKHFVQWISREGKGRERPEIARAWVRQLVAAIRAEDPVHLITVGLVDWSLPRPGLDSAFHPDVIAPELDFLSIHLYPEKGKVNEAIDTLKAFNVGKPVVIEETFLLKCSVAEFDEFFRRSKSQAAGWIGFYWGRTPEECRRSPDFADALMLQWLEWFQKARR